jgi:hypothetical protein
MATGLKNYGKNIYTAPNGLIRRTVRTGSMGLIKELYTHATTVCRHQISEQYIADVLNPDNIKFSKGYSYFLKDELVGFVVWTVKNMDTIPTERPRMSKNTTPEGPTKILYIDLICAKETGTTLGYTMLYDVESYCIDEAIPFIKLTPAEQSLIPYYEKYGFTLTSKEKETIMTKAVVALLKTNPHNYKTAKTRKAKYTRPKISERDKNAIESYLGYATKLSQNIKYMDEFIKNLPASQYSL